MGEQNHSVFCYTSLPPLADRGTILVLNFATEVSVMKTEMVAKWVVVEGRLELQWSIKEENWVIRMNRLVVQMPKAA
jgi:hypothetical protein